MWGTRGRGYSPGVPSIPAGEFQLRDEKQGLFRNQPPFLGPSESEIARNLSRSKGVRFHCIELQTKMCDFDFAPMCKSDVGGQCDFELAQLDFRDRAVVKSKRRNAVVVLVSA